jgi:hypothetical protein
MNIIFFLVIGLLGILSYLQARKTIFTPLKTETFKLQLTVFQDIFQYFDHHKKDLYILSFDSPKIFKINSSLLINKYAETFFKDEIQISKEKTAQMIAEAPFMKMSIKHIDKINITDDGRRFDFANINIDVQDHSARLAEWLKYEYIMIRYTIYFENQMDQLANYISSPLIPSNVKRLLREFQTAVESNLNIMAEVLTDAAKELPQKYPSADAFLNIEMSWAWNMFIDKRIDLEPISDKIYQQINDYLNIDKLLR